MSHLDHPNIVKFFEFYQDDKFFHIVMEVCTGFDLFDEVKHCNTFSEQRTKEVVFKIVSGIYYSHLEGIIHRDLKLDNIMFESMDKDAQVKIIDWGLSAKFEKDSNYLSSVAGTPQFVAPEVFQGEYDYKCDVWSIGVIAYVLLSLKYPYNGSTVKEYIHSLAVDTVDYNIKEFKDKNITDDCRNFIQQCLTQNPDERPEIKECYNHKWFNDVKKKQMSIETIKPEIMDRLRKYTAPTSKLQSFISEHFINLLLLPNEINHLRDTFQALDVDGTGYLKTDELLRAFEACDIEVEEEEIKDIIKNTKNSKAKKSGMISYSEFLIAAIDQAKVIDRDNLIKVFNYFDVDNTGFIDIKNLKSLLLRTMKKDRFSSDREFEEIIKEVVNCSHKTVINLDDFLSFFNIENS